MQTKIEVWVDIKMYDYLAEKALIENTSISEIASSILDQCKGCYESNRKEREEQNEKTIEE